MRRALLRIAATGCCALLTMTAAAAAPPPSAPSEVTLDGRTPLEPRVEDEVSTVKPVVVDVDVPVVDREPEPEPEPGPRTDASPGPGEVLVAPPRRGIGLLIGGAMVLPVGGLLTLVGATEATSNRGRGIPLLVAGVAGLLGGSVMLGLGGFRANQYARWARRRDVAVAPLLWPGRGAGLFVSFRFAGRHRS